MLVLDDDNKVPLTTLYELGLLKASDYTDMMNKLNDGETVKTPTGKIDYATAMGQKLAMIPAADQYVKDANGDYTYIGDDADAIAERFDSAEQLKIVGVVKPIKDASATPLATGIGYTRALTDELIDHANSSAIVTDQEKDKTRDVLNGLAFSPSDDAAKAADAKTYVASLGVSDKANMAKAMMQSQSAQSAQPGQAGQSAAGGQWTAAMSEQQLADSFDQYIATASQDVLVKIYDQYVSTGTYDDNLAAFGVVSRDVPSTINIYTDSFEDKDHVSKAITDYNKTVPKADKIVYTDYVGLMMSSVTTIINVISYVLIAFVSVSLVVSSIMIGIITYISVLERTKGNRHPTRNGCLEAQCVAGVQRGDRTHRPVRRPDRHRRDAAAAHTGQPGAAPFHRHQRRERRAAGGRSGDPGGAQHGAHPYRRPDSVAQGRQADPATALRTE